MISLQGDDAMAGLGELRHLGKLAPGHPGIEIFAAQDIGEVTPSLMMTLFTLRLISKKTGDPGWSSSYRNRSLKRFLSPLIVFQYVCRPTESR